MVGRDSRQLPLTDNTVSRRHFELHQEDDEWVLHDLGSSNGTYVNGGRVVQKKTLKLGDQIRLGRTILVFGAQPGVTRVGGGNVSLAGQEAGMDSSIMHTVQSSEDSMVLAVPEPAAAAMTNLKLLYQLNAALGSSVRHRPDPRRRDGPGLRVHQGRPRHPDAGGRADQRAGPQGRPHPRRGRQGRRRHPQRRRRDRRRRVRRLGRRPAPHPGLPHDHQPRADHRRGRALQQRDVGQAVQQGQERPRPGHPLGPVRADQVRASSTRSRRARSSASSTSTARSATTPTPPTSSAC